MNKTFLFLFIAFSLFAKAQLTNVNLSLNLDSSLNSKNFDGGEIFWGDTIEGQQNLFNKFYDVFGNTIPNELLFRGSKVAALKHKQFKGRKKEIGIFVVNYHGDDIAGFEDPIKGAARRSIFETVLRDISTLFKDVPNDPCTGQTAQVHILVNSRLQFPSEAVLANASSAYTFNNLNNAIVDGEVWKVINTGQASQRNINHGFINVNFDHDFYLSVVPLTFGNNRIMPDEHDLYSVVLHEVMHLLGFNSFIATNGQSLYENRNVFTRLDNLMFNGTKKSIQSDNNFSSFFDLRSTIGHQDVRAGCGINTLRPASGCAFLQSDLGLFSPSDYVKGSSLSHIDKVCEGDNYVMHPSLSGGEFNRRLNENEIAILNEIGYITSGIYGEGSGVNSVNYGLKTGVSVSSNSGNSNCINTSMNYAYRSCGSQNFVEIELDLDLQDFTGINGFKYEGESLTDIEIVGKSIRFKILENTESVNTINLAPTFGCVNGSILTLKVYVSQCISSICTTSQGNLCDINCNYNFNDGVALSNCEAKSEDPQNSIKFSDLLDNWDLINEASSDYMLIDGDKGIRAIANKGYSEGAYTNYDFKSGTTYKLKIVFRTGSSCDNFPRPDTVNIVIGEGNYSPAPGANPTDLENYLNGYNVELISVIEPKSLQINNRLSTFEICFKPSKDFNFAGFYAVDDSPAIRSIFVSEFSVQELDLDEIEDVVLQNCNDFKQLEIGNDCLLYDELNYSWEKVGTGEISNTKFVEISESGDYILNLNLLNGEMCFHEEFVVTNEGSLDLNITTLNANCSNNFKGSISVAVKNSLPNTVYTYEWDDGQVTSTINDLSPGIYRVKVSDGVCFVESTIEVIEDFDKIPLEITCSEVNFEFCEGDNLSLFEKNNVKVNWLLNGSPISGAQNTSSIIANESGVYTIVPTNDNNFCYLKDEVSVAVKPLPFFNVLANPNEICLGESVNLGAVNFQGGGTFNSNGTFNWSGGGINSSENPVTVTPNQIGTITYTQTFTDTEGCSASESVDVLVNPVPTVNVNADNINACPDEMVELNAVGQPSGGTFIWSTGETGSSINVVNPQGSYPYTVQYNLNGCTASDDITIERSGVTFNEITTSQQCSGQSGIGTTIFGSTPSGGSGQYSYNWEVLTITLSGGGLFGGGFFNTTWTTPLVGNSTQKDFTIPLTLTSRCYRRVVTDATGCTSTSNVVCTNSILQANDQKFPQKFESSKKSAGFDIETDQLNNTYIFGTYDDFVEIDGKQFEAGLRNGGYFITKLDPCGNELWTVNGKNILEERSNPVLNMDNDGFLYLSATVFGLNGEVVDGVGMSFSIINNTLLNLKINSSTGEVLAISSLPGIHSNTSVNKVDDIIVSIASENGRYTVYTMTKDFNILSQDNLAILNSASFHAGRVACENQVSNNFHYLGLISNSNSVAYNSNIGPGSSGITIFKINSATNTVVWQQFIAGNFDDESLKLKNFDSENRLMVMSSGPLVSIDNITGDIQWQANSGVVDVEFIDDGPFTPKRIFTTSESSIVELADESNLFTGITGVNFVDFKNYGSDMLFTSLSSPNQNFAGPIRLMATGAFINTLDIGGGVLNSTKALGFVADLFEEDFTLVDNPNPNSDNPIINSALSTDVKALGALNSDKLKLYPIPASDKIFLEGTNSKSLRNSDYTIFDASGKIVLSGNIKNGENSLSVATLVDGIYFIRVVNMEGGAWQSRFSVKK